MFGVSIGAGGCGAAEPLAVADVSVLAQPDECVKRVCPSLRCEHAALPTLLLQPGPECSDSFMVDGVCYPWVLRCMHVGVRCDALSIRIIGCSRVYGVMPDRCLMFVVVHRAL